MTAKRAPEAPKGLEWVVIPCSARYPRMPALRVRSGQGPPHAPQLPDTRLRANKGEI